VAAAGRAAMNEVRKEPEEKKDAPANVEETPPAA
jgi:hypothetical protein